MRYISLQLTLTTSKSLHMSGNIFILLFSMLIYIDTQYTIYSVVHNLSLSVSLPCLANKRVHITFTTV